MEPRVHRVAEVEWKSPGSLTCSSRATQDHVQMDFGCLQGQRLHTCPGQTVQVLRHSIKTGFLMFRGTSMFSFAPISSDPVTGSFLNDFSFVLSGQKSLQVLPSFGLQCDRQLYLFTFISSPAIKWSVLFLCLIACGRQGCSLYSDLQCSRN